MSNSVGWLRELLISDWDRWMVRWRIPGRVCEYEKALKSGAAVGVSADMLLCAYSHAGLPWRQFAYGGADWGKSFVLDERDELTEWRE
jgi:hypothetical protein